MNTISLTGRLTADPELRSTRNGTAVCTLRIAVPRLRGSDGEDRGAAFVDVETWGSQATNAAKYLASGRAVAVTGRLEHQEWTGQDDIRRQRVYVVADEPRGVEFLDRPGDDREPVEPTAA